MGIILATIMGAVFASGATQDGERAVAEVAVRWSNCVDRGVSNAPVADGYERAMRNVLQNCQPLQTQYEALARRTFSDTEAERRRQGSTEADRWIERMVERALELSRDRFARRTADLAEARGMARCNIVPLPRDAPGACPGWRSLGRQDGFEEFVDPATLVRDGTTLFTIKMRGIVDTTVNSVRSYIYTRRFDCGARTAVDLHFIAFSPEGRTISEVTPAGRHAEPKPQPAGSGGATLLNDYCARAGAASVPAVTRGPRQAWLGVALAEATPEAERAFNLRPGEGAIVFEAAPGGPAHRAGLLRGDVIMRVNNQAVTREHPLAAQIAGLPVGARATIELVRNERPMTVEAILVERPPNEPAMAAAARTETPAAGPNPPPGRPAALPRNWLASTLEMQRDLVLTRGGGAGLVTPFRAELSLTATGQVTHCRVTQTTNRQFVDALFCSQARSARFIPATDANGAPVPSNYQLEVPQFRVVAD